MIPVKSFRERRRHLASQMQKGVAIIPTAPEQVRNRDAHYPYRFDSYFYYLTGFREPEAVLVIVAETDENASKHILFCRDKDLEREIWDGFRYGPEAAREAFDFDETYPIFRLDDILPGLLANQPAVFCSLGHDTTRYGSRRAVESPRPPQSMISGFCWMRCVCLKARKNFRSCAARPRFPVALIAAPCGKPGLA